MKKLIFFVIILGFAFLVVFLLFLNENRIFFNSNQEKAVFLSPTVKPIPSLKPTNFFEVEFNQQKYIVYFFPLIDRKIEIIPNFSQKRLAKAMVKEAGCLYAINGGFYTKEEEPLGLFVVNGKVYSTNMSKSSFLNGYFYLDEQNRPQISSNQPQTSKNVIQAGPFIDNSFYLKISADEEARRTVIVETEENGLYAFSIIKKDTPYFGPLLADLPPLLFSINSPLKVKKALNLDGGSASVYFESDFHLSELSPVGSLICVK